MERILISLNMIYILLIGFSTSLVLDNPDLSDLIVSVSTFFWLFFSILTIIVSLIYDLLNDFTLKRR